MDPVVSRSASPDEPAPRGRKPLAWFVLLSSAVAAGVYLFVGWSGREAPGWGARELGRALFALLVAFLAAVLAWRLSARSRQVFQGIFSAMLLLMASTELRGWWARTANAEATRSLESEMAAVRDSLLSDDPAVLSAAQDRLAEARRRAAGTSQGDLALVLRATTEVADPMSRRRKEYEAAVHRLTERHRVVGTEDDVGDLLRARRAALSEVLRLAREQEEAAAGLEAALDRAMERAGIGPRSRAELLATGRPSREALRTVARQEVVIVGLLAEQQSVLEEHVGRWRLEEATGSYAFSDPAAAQRFEDLHRSVKEAEALQDQARRRAVVEQGP